MVLRGSKIAPDSNLREAISSSKESREQAEFVRRELDRVQGTAEALEVIAASAHGDPAKPLTTAELHQALAALQSRIDALERSQADAELQRTRSQQAVRRTLLQLACGGLAGAAARTTVAPLDRVKILMQTQHISLQGAPDKYKGITHSVRTIIKEEGLLKLWRGNTTNVLRVLPYSATQFASYDVYKAWISRPGQDFFTVQRLLAGALAGMTATTITHPLDVVRLRLAVERQLKGGWDALSHLLRESGPRALFKGYVPTIVSLSPFIAINFATFDTLKSFVYPQVEGQPPPAQRSFVILGLGAVSGLFAQTVCYPLDTVRRRMQLRGKVYNGTIHALRTIATTEGFAGLYKGMVPNALKVVPNNAIRFLVYDFLKRTFNIKGGAGNHGG